MRRLPPRPRPPTLHEVPCSSPGLCRSPVYPIQCRACYYYGLCVECVNRWYRDNPESYIEPIVGLPSDVELVLQICMNLSEDTNVPPPPK